MARIRTIKPEFWTDEELSALPEATHMLAGALLNYSDDFGYFNANAALVKAACSPIREPLVSIPESLRSLQTVGYIRLGTAPDGKRYGHVIKFSEHQRVSHPTPSKISGIPITWDCLENPPENLRKAPETFRPEQGTGNREQGIDQKSLSSPAASDPAEVNDKRAERLREITKDAVTAYNAVLAKPLGKLAAVSLINEVREKQVRGCLKVAREICARLYQSPTVVPRFWEDYFAECSRDPFKNGTGPYSPPHANWRPSFEYLANPETMTAVFDKAMSEQAA